MQEVGRVRQGRESTVRETTRIACGESSPQASDGARKRAAIEMIASHEGALKRTARRYSLDSEDADDAYQRALEIVLTKAPTTDPRELIRWTQTVTKHEALAVRQIRERLLGHRTGAEGGGELDPVALIPAPTAGPDEQAERRETVARSREALRALKPAELRALTLLAEGYSYAEIGEITGFSRTKINRVLAEGRDRFRTLLSSSEDGSRCRQLQPLLSAFCDGEASPKEATAVREHLRACAPCRSTMRTYRAAPRIAVALAPALPLSRSLLGRAQEVFGGLTARLPGIGGDPAAQVGAAGGSRGAGMAALAKLLAVCAGAAGGTAACVATGVVPSPIAASPHQAQGQPAKRSASRPIEEAVQYEPAPPAPPQPEPSHRHPSQPGPEEAVEPEVAAPTGAVEYVPPPAPPTPEPVESSNAGSGASSDSAAGEFGP
jgi:RNA polymerase sigma factor (sigma-70 family)